MPWAMCCFGTCRRLGSCRTKTPSYVGEQTATSTTWYKHDTYATAPYTYPIQVAALRTLGLDVQQLQRNLKREVRVVVPFHLLNTNAGCFQEVPFAFAVPDYPTPSGPPLPGTFAAKNEQPPSSAVPSFLPAFPDPHTYAIMMSDLV